MKWTIKIPNFLGGMAPGFWKSDYPSYGNKNQAGKMQHVDLTDPAFITQGPALATLTNGSQAGKVTTLIRSILPNPALYGGSGDYTYGIGGNLLYAIGLTTVVDDGNFPHTIDKATVTGETGEDVALFQEVLYYSYNHSGGGGDIGTFDLTNTFDDDWGSTVPAGAAALQSTYPHPMCVAGNDTLYIGNKNYVTSWDGTTFVEQDLDLPSNVVITDMVWTSNRLWIAVATTGTSVSYRYSSSIYVWDGAALSWEDEIRIKGIIRSLYVKNGSIFVWYGDSDQSSVLHLGYLAGLSVRKLADFSGSASYPLPKYYSVTEYQDFLAWITGNKVWLWGAVAENMPPMSFQYMSGGYSVAEAISAPFNTLLCASNSGTDYKLAKTSGYDVNCNWKSLQFDISGNRKESVIDRMIVNYVSPAANARVDLTLTINEGADSWTGSISHTADGTKTQKEFPINKRAQNVRVELDWTNGSATNPLKIKNIKILGHTVGAID